MSPKIFLTTSRSLCLGSLAMLALHHSRAHAQAYDPEWSRTFRLGVLVGFNLKANFTQNGSFGISGSGAGVYDDGYVRPDDGGATTTDWGYNNASQYNSGSETLTLHRTTAYTATGSAKAQDSLSLGLDLAYGGTLVTRERIRLGWEFGFGFLPVKMSDRSSLAASASQSAYTFDASGYVLNTFPSPGYHGNPNGGAPLGSTPLGAPTVTTLNGVTLTGRRTLDVNFYAFKLGPTLFFDLSPSVGLTLGAGPALGLVSGNLKWDETLTYTGGSSRNVGRTSATDITYGGYVNGMITFHTVQNGDLFLGAQYMPLGKVNLGGGGRNARLNLNGALYVTAGINWPF